MSGWPRPSATSRGLSHPQASRWSGASVDRPRTVGDLAPLLSEPLPPNRWSLAMSIQSSISHGSRRRGPGHQRRATPERPGTPTGETEGEGSQRECGQSDPYRPWFSTLERLLDRRGIHSHRTPPRIDWCLRGQSIAQKISVVSQGAGSSPDAPCHPRLSGLRSADRL